MVDFILTAIFFYFVATGMVPGYIIAGFICTSSIGSSGTSGGLGLWYLISGVCGILLNIAIVLSYFFWPVAVLPISGVMFIGVLGAVLLYLLIK